MSGSLFHFEKNRWTATRARASEGQLEYVILYSQMEVL